MKTARVEHQPAPVVEFGEIVALSLNEIYVFDPETLRFRYANQGALTNLGYSLAEMRVLTPLDLKPEFTEPAFRAMIQPLLTGERELLVFETVHRRADASLYPVEVHLQLVGQGSGRSFLAVIFNISERKQAEERLRESEALHRSLFENIQQGVTYHAADISLIAANPAAERIMGMSAETIRRSGDQAGPLLRALRPDGSPLPVDEHPVVVALRSGRPVNRYLMGLRPPGHRQPIWLSVSSFPVFRPGATSPYQIHTICDDITQQRRDEEAKARLQAQLQQAQKMEAIGILAGGIAHDFNNILGTILGFADLAREEVPVDSGAARDLGKVLRAATRAKDLVKQILAFSRQSQACRIELSIPPLIKEWLKMLRAALPSTIRIVEDISPHCGLVLADPSQVHQVLMNLCTNALHAMETTGGTLTVAVQPVRIELPAAGGLAAGDYAVLTVTDTGGGIAPDIIDSIFYPYFTTKEVGKGTGMGLAICHGIVKEYGGEITVQSTPGHGATFEVYLPVIGGRDTVMAIDSEPPLPASGSGHILLVDDEELLLEMSTNMLRRLGYTVTAYACPLKALGALRQEAERFDLLITDQTMPHMTGIELAQEVGRLRPQLPVILCSGFSHLVDEQTAKAQGIREFILKPISRRQMARIIPAVLGREG